VVLLQLGALTAGGAVTFFLWPFIHQVALAIGIGVAIAGVLLVGQLSGKKEKREASEDVLALLAHLRQMLSRGIKSHDALRTFAAEVEPGRALALRSEKCLTTVALGGDLYRAFEMWVAQDNPHLQALSDLLREVDESTDPRATMDRLSRKVLRDLQREMRFAGKRRALAGIVVTVVGLFPALMLALLEPTVIRLANSVMFK
jgi:ferric-dicitrate binding protein FerR (iron transport regulator)